MVGDALLDRPCMVFHIMCVCCACGPSERLDAPSIRFVCVFVCRKVESSGIKHKYIVDNPGTFEHPGIFLAGLVLLRQFNSLFNLENT